MAIVTRQGEGKYKIHIKYYVELLAVVPFRSGRDGMKNHIYPLIYYTYIIPANDTYIVD